MDEIAIAMENSDGPAGEAMENPLPVVSEEHQVICATIESELRLQELLYADQGSNPSSYQRKSDAMNNPDFPSIFKFPDRTDAPTVATIGPYHRSLPADDLIITDAKKSRHVNFLARHLRLNIGKFLGWVLKNEEKARGCYERGSLGHIQDSKDFAKMLLLDGCLLLFAIFLLRPTAQIDPRPPANMDGHERFKDEFLDISSDISFNTQQLKLELLMLDNQIPFFVVQELYEQLQESLFKGVNAGSIKEIALSCFDDVHPKCKYMKCLPERVHHHLLHLFHWSRSPAGKYNVKVDDFLTNQLPKSHLLSATELSESAIYCEKQPQHSSLELSFHRPISFPFRASVSYYTLFHLVLHMIINLCLGMNGNMKIPTLYLSDHSELIFRNLIAFEQKHLRCGLSVTAFCTCMAGLLQSETDAKLLRKNRILAPTNKTDQEIVDFFRELSGEYKQTIITEDLFVLCKDVATHRESDKGRFMENFLGFFPNRWTAVSIIVALLALVINAAGTMYTVYRTYHPAVKR